MSTPYSVKLNHLMQQRRESYLLSTSEVQVGGAWKIEYKVNGEVKGVGIAPQKNAARELAAQQAYANLGGN
ncbi:double-stranded RNA binding motif-containing protein [Phanerochaete sordida]|uniref:Double-stranded RNA binding motif-containing protein n=1 Tax=Phanerochaete sordida TaxID=48140 RepID=A0A9P3G236_9APHY|nr:double-stranded RNA binding motif-containing protein [Phanerochaete sordida]